MKFFVLITSLGVLGGSLPAYAQTPSEEDYWYDLNLEQLMQVQPPPNVQVGSRHGERAVQSTAVPTDVYTSEQLLSVGEGDLARALAALIPGFNYPRPSIADGTDHAPPFTLRTLQPDQVLVLVNGKRLHTSALMHNNGTIGRGSSGVDLNTIPLLAIERVEVLRDGAAAQYGSDALAGIINIILKGYGQKNMVHISAKRTHAQDGLGRQADAFFSKPLSGDGFFNLSVSQHNNNATNRAHADTRDNGVVNTHFGDASSQSQSLAWSMELPRGDSTIYSHGSWNHRNGSAGAFFRRADDERNIPEIYPDGFLPLIEPKIDDLSATVGMKGVFMSHGSWDISYTHGSNKFHFFVRDTLNRSLGLKTPLSFDSGGSKITQDILNLDLNHRFGAHSLSAGYEYRRESYQIFAGETASYLLGEEAGWYPGAQGFSGFRPENEVFAKRTSASIYADLNYIVNHYLTVNTSARAEKFSDFGSTLNGKLALLFKPSPSWLLRTSTSTGFRAPSLGQANFTSTAMIRDGDEIYQFGNYGVNHPVAQALGARELKPEKSKHFTAGLVWKPSNQIMASIDGFTTTINNRIMSTSYIAAWNLEGLSPQALEVLQKQQVDGAMYFANAASTRTNGFDIRLDYKIDLAPSKQWHWTAAYSYARTKIKSVNKAPDVLGVDMSTLILDPFVRVTMEAGQPRSALKLWTHYTTPTYSLSFNASRYGKFYSTHGDEKIGFAARWVLDTQLNYAINKNAFLTFGVNNVFNSKPQEWGDTTDSLTGSGKPIAYSQYAPFGYNGRSYYFRLGIKF